MQYSIDLDLKLDNQYLRNLNCVINELYKVIICLTCKTIVSRSMFDRHLRGHFQTTRTFKREDMDKAFEGLNAQGVIQLPTVPGETIAEVIGLEVKNGVSCHLCYYFALTPGSMRSHFQKAHPGPIQATPVKIQTQNHSGRDSYFGVHKLANEMVRLQDQMWDVVKKSLSELGEERLDDPLVNDERFQSQFERSVRWNIQVQGKDPSVLFGLASAVVSSRDPLFPLSSACASILSSINQDIKVGDRILLGKLIGYLPTQFKLNYLRKPNQRFSSVGLSTLQRYASVMARLISFCIRSCEREDAWNVPFTQEEKDSIQLVKMSLGDQQILVTSIKALMLCLIKSPRSATILGQTHCPIWRFLISFSILRQGGFADEEVVSHACAALKFCWRSVIYEESVRLMKENYEHNHDYFEKQLQRFIEPGNRTSWDSIKDSMDAAKSALHHRTTLAGFEWVDGTNHHEMIMNGKHLSLTGLSTAITIGLSAAIKHLTDNVLDGLSLYVVPRVIPIDRRKNSHRNYSFIIDSSNPYLEFRYTLLRHLTSRGRLGVLRNGTFIWDERACREFLRQTDTFRKMMFPLIHFQYGACSRSTEAGALTWRGDGWRPPSIKYAHGMVLLLSTYNKTNSITGVDKPIAR